MEPTALLAAAILALAFAFWPASQTGGPAEKEPRLPSARDITNDPSGQQTSQPDDGTPISHFTYGLNISPRSLLASVKAFVFTLQATASASMMSVLVGRCLRA